MTREDCSCYGPSRVGHVSRYPGDSQGRAFFTRAKTDLAFNNIDRPIPVNNVGSDLAKAMKARPFSYQFFRVAS